MLRQRPEIWQLMKSELWMPRIIATTVCTVLLLSSAILAQQTVTVHAVVTANTRLDAEGTLTIPRKSIAVDLGRKRQKVFGWMPLRGARAGLQLAVLIDDSSSGNFSPELNDVESFLDALPPTTQIAVGHMQNGRADIPQSFTSNHALAANELWRPMPVPDGDIISYSCLSDLLTRWPGGDKGLRREVIMITDGTDSYFSCASYSTDDRNVRAAITDAQKGDIIVYSISFAGAGPMDGGDLARSAALHDLVQLSDATGGHAYHLSFGRSVTLAPFLFDILHKLDNQYEVSFVAVTKRRLQPFAVKTTEPDTSLKVATHILVNNR